jgi:AraC-like DNA-binding protein
VRRKLIRAGQRTVSARLHVGAAEAVLGVPASEVAGRIIALDELWGDAATQPLFDRLISARTPTDAAAIMENTIAERLAQVDDARAKPHLALKAAEKLVNTNVNTVAVDLGVSERHLRRIFREAFGVSPKAYAKLARFNRALHAAREGGCASWASIAAASGYYDQAHLIDEFRTIAGVTPRALLGELGGPPQSRAISL